MNLISSNVLGLSEITLVVVLAQIGYIFNYLHGLHFAA